MKVLFRNYHPNESGNRTLTYDWWKCNVKNSKDNYLELVDPTSGEVKNVYKNEILYIKGDTRNKYIKCKTCKEVVLNTPDAIEKHFRKRESQANCLECPSMDFRYSACSDSTLSSKIKIMEDGTVVQTTKRKGYLHCKNTYTKCNEALTTDDTYYMCKFRRCRHYGVEPAFEEDIFSKYPNFFKTVVTEKQLINCGWILDYTGDNGERIYKTPGVKNIICAVLDMNGVVMYFTVDFRKREIDFMYSPYTKEHFFVYKRYIRKYLHCDMSDTQLETIKKKLDKLYGIETKKEKKGNK